MIDSDTKRFTVDLLLAWKMTAEENAFIEIVGKNFERHYPSSPAAVHSPIPKIHGLDYEIARPLLIDSGWQPLMHHWSHGSDPMMTSGNGKYFWDKGYWEISQACPTGLANCLFVFTDVYGNRLLVGTAGEVYPEFGAAATVLGWHFEKEARPEQQIQAVKKEKLHIVEDYGVKAGLKQPSLFKSVYIMDGNLFGVYAGDSIKQITFAGIDSAPYLSIDKREVIFLRDYGDVSNKQKLNQIWAVNLISFKEDCILKSGELPNKQMITGRKIYIDTFGNKIGHVFKAIVSINSNFIYFMSRAWATSAAIFSFNRSDKKIKFIADGSCLYLIEGGDFKSKLITCTHKYNRQGGSYDFFYIIDPKNGKEIKTIGEDLEKWLREVNLDLTGLQSKPVSAVHSVSTEKVRLKAGNMGKEGQLVHATSIAGAHVNTAEFDVFLCHNSIDKPMARRLGEELRGRSLSVWLDEWELVPGRPWQEALEEIIEAVAAVAILVGPDGLGPWQDSEMRAFLSEFVRRRVPVIPVLLPGLANKPELPLFLKQFTWVDLRSGISVGGLDRLQWGITGRKPTGQ